MAKAISQLNSEQKAALKILSGEDNVFLTGAAGAGKSFVLKAYLKSLAHEVRVPVLASTGAAAILVGGRTFHSFFGLGIMEGGVSKTVERALKNRRVTQRLERTDAVIIDEISMISGPTLRAAEAIARGARGSSTPWGGLRVIAVGDFAQLPPVNPFSPVREWAFLEQTWDSSDFQSAMLNEIMRTSHAGFLEVLNEVRAGQVGSLSRDFLNSRTKRPDALSEATHLFPRRDSVERHNLEKLAQLPTQARAFTTDFTGRAQDIEQFRKHSPVPDTVQLKEGALVMLRQNDPDGKWVNGSLGHIRAMSTDELTIELMRGKTDVVIPRAEFKLLDADGTPVVTAKNFPVSLAWAMTIHKAQGATLDRVHLDLRRAWDPGQAYVALSRVRDPEGLTLEGWSPDSILSDPQVAEFYSGLGG